MFALPKPYLSQFQYTIVTWAQRELLNPTLTSDPGLLNSAAPS